MSADVAVRDVVTTALADANTTGTTALASVLQTCGVSNLRECRVSRYTQRNKPIPPDRTIDLVGRRFGRLVVVVRDGSRNGGAAWQCQCDCGQTRRYTGHILCGGGATSCGCGRRGKRQRRRQPFEYSREVVDQARSLIATGITIRDVGEAVGLSRATVFRLMCRHGLVAAQRGPRRRSPVRTDTAAQVHPSIQLQLLPLPDVRICGVYAIMNRVNGNRYIGSSSDVDSRIRAHILTLDRGTHQNQHLQRAWRKYGATAFAFVVVEEVADESLLQRIEQAHIDGVPSGRLYNIVSRADRPPSRKGAKMPADAIAALSERSKKAIRTPEWRARMSASLKGKPKSAAHRVKMAAASRGRNRSAAAKQKWLIWARTAAGHAALAAAGRKGCSSRVARLSNEEL